MPNVAKPKVAENAAAAASKTEQAKNEAVNASDEVQLLAVARSHNVSLQAVKNAIMLVGTNKGAIDAALATRATSGSDQVNRSGGA